MLVNKSTSGLYELINPWGVTAQIFVVSWERQMIPIFEASWSNYNIYVDKNAEDDVCLFFSLFVCFMFWYQNWYCDCEISEDTNAENCVCLVLFCPNPTENYNNHILHDTDWPWSMFLFSIAVLSRGKCSVHPINKPFHSSSPDSSVIKRQ